MDEANELRAHKLLVSRLEAMGIEMTSLPGERCSQGELVLRSSRFSGPSGTLQIQRVRFATVGGGQLKCLAPEALFQLPMISIASCSDARQIEERIRATWSRHVQALRETAQLLDRIGAEAYEELGGAGLAFSLGLENQQALARCLDARHVVLPGTGPLSGMRLTSPNQRIARLDPTAESAVDLEIALTGRVEAIGRKAERAEATRRREAAATATQSPDSRRDDPVPTLAPVNAGRVLLVGAILGRDQTLRSALRRLGLQVRIEYSSAEALSAFRDQTFDLVLTDAHLGRSEGIELIPEISMLPGIDRVPVVLVDEHLRAQRRQAARDLGAAGYLVHPIDPERIVPGIQRMASGQRGRRFTRLDHRLHVQWEGMTAGFTRSIGRGGLFVRAERDGIVPEIASLELALPELGERIQIETRSVYRREAAGSPDAGIGLRFHRFPNRDEARWIAYLTAVMGQGAEQ